MKLVRWVMNVVLTLCKPFLLFLKINPNKITFISLESKVLTGDFQLVAIDLEKYRDYEIEYILVKFERTIAGYISYFFSCIKQFFAINTSKLVILDYNNFVANGFKRKGVTILQLWHATGAIKKFGNDTFRDYPLEGYDALIVNSEAFIPFYSSAFNMQSSQIYVTGIPKTDRLFNQEKITGDKEMLYQMFPQIKGKKVILYAPTFRGKLFHGFNDLQVDLGKVVDKLNDDYIILYKMHPLVSHMSFENHERLINCNHLSIRKLFSIADILISDYSAIIYDFSVFEKPMIFYTPDLEAYKERVGIYIDYENEIPGPICMNEQQLIDILLKNEYDLEKVRMFKHKYFTYFDGQSTKRVTELIDKLMN